MSFLNTHIVTELDALRTIKLSSFSGTFCLQSYRNISGEILACLSGSCMELILVHNSYKK